MNLIHVKTAIQLQRCPVHNIQPSLKTDNDQITIRCCCDYFTSKCLNYMDSLLKNYRQVSITDAWEKDTFKRRLQLR